MTVVRFVAACVRGSGRGASVGFPTVNLRTDALPVELIDGVYACKVTLDDSPTLNAIMHKGPRPSFGDTPSCEVHVLDAEISNEPVSCDVRVIGRIRSVQTFASADDLAKQIVRDIATARAMLEEDAYGNQEAHR